MSFALRMTEVIRVIKRFESFVLGKCRCGCNNEMEIRNSRKYLKRFKKGHNRMFETGALNPAWKGGKIIVNRGYKKIKKPDHPFCDANGYVLEHRLIYEEYYKCCLLPWIVIHHICKNTGNNNIENLQPLNKSQHHFIHHKKDFSDRYC